MNSLTFLTILAAFFWGYFTGMYGKQTTQPQGKQRGRR